MFPPQSDQIWDDSWQAIPIHTIPDGNDYILGHTLNCPLYDKAYKEYEQSDEIQSILRKNRPLIEYLENHTGANITNIRVAKIYMTLLVEHLKNFT